MVVAECPQPCCMHVGMRHGDWGCCTVSHDHIMHCPSRLHAHIVMQEICIGQVLDRPECQAQCQLTRSHCNVLSSSLLPCYAKFDDSECVYAGGDILEGMPPGQVKAARKMLQDLHVSIVTNAMVGHMHPQQVFKPACPLLVHCRPGPTLHMSMFSCAWCTCFMSPLALLVIGRLCHPCLLVCIDV